MNKLQVINPNAVYDYKATRSILKMGKLASAKYVREGELRPSRVAGSFLFTGEEILRFLKAQTEKGVH